MPVKLAQFTSTSVQAPPLRSPEKANSFGVGASVSGIYRAYGVYSVSGSDDSSPVISEDTSVSLCERHYQCVYKLILWSVRYVAVCQNIPLVDEVNPPARKYK